MSHFVVLVLTKEAIGDRGAAEAIAAEALAPYEEVEGNEDARWDWWVIGGRWTGFLDGYDPAADPVNHQRCNLCQGTGRRTDKLGREARRKDPKYTCNGCGGKGWHVAWSLQPHDGDWQPVRKILGMKDLPFAIVADGTWHQKAEMGWWGMTRNEDEGWPRKARALLKGHAAETAIVVDCHI